MKVGIILGSIRQGRQSERLAKWVQSELSKQKDVSVTMIDLLDYPLPLFDEPMSPQYNPDRKTNGVLADYLKIVGDQDGIVLVTPEYNRSYSSAAKNALDYLDFQLKRKPVMLVAHGSTGGAQAISHLRAVFPGLLAVTSPGAVMVNGQLSAMFDENGKINDSNPIAEHVKANLDRATEEFLWLVSSLNEGRAKATS